MSLPARAIQAIRPQASLGVMASASVVAAIFAATPFLLPDVSQRMAVDIGRTGLLSTAQVGSFAAASFFAGRLLRPRRRLHYASLVLVGLATLGSAISPGFTLLLATRVVAGLGMGTLTWIAWADATRFVRGIGDVAVVAPLTATVASPILGWLTDHGGYHWVYAALGLFALTATLLPVGFGDLPRIGRRVSKSRSNRFLLGAGLILTLGGSSVFIFTGAAASGVHGLSPVALSWALSLNAVTGALATRRAAKRGFGGIWILGAAASALVVGTIGAPLVFFLAMAVWGFSFWMAVPEVFRLLADRSHTASERMGDVQAVMALGRIFGPIMGGLALGVGHFARLSVVGSIVITVSAMLVFSVEWYRAR